MRNKSNLTIVSNYIEVELKSNYLIPISVTDLKYPMILYFNKITKRYLDNTTEFSKFKCSFFDEEKKK